MLLLFYSHHNFHPSPCHLSLFFWPALFHVILNTFAYNHNALLLVTPHACPLLPHTPLHFVLTIFYISHFSPFHQASLHHHSPFSLMPFKLLTLLCFLPVITCPFSLPFSLSLSLLTLHLVPFSLFLSSYTIFLTIPWHLPCYSSTLFLEVLTLVPALFLPSPTTLRH